jgi:hypothetical protein
MGEPRSVVRTLPQPRDQRTEKSTVINEETSTLDHLTDLSAEIDTLIKTTTALLERLEAEEVYPIDQLPEVV